MNDTNTLRRRNRKLMVRYLVPIAVLMFIVAFVQIPLFRMACQRLGFALSPVGQAKETAGGRAVDVLFTGVVEGNLPVYFTPKHSYETVHIGQRFENEYHFVNLSGDSVYFRPVHSILPEDAAKKFTMMKCFCFDDQALGPREEKTFPVIAILSSDLDPDVQQVTLNYTLFGKSRSEMQKGRKIPNVEKNPDPAKEATLAP